MKLDIISEKQEWGDVLARFRQYDFCHTYDFHEISHQNGEGNPLLFAVSDDEGRLILSWPVLKREIAETDWFDLTSVYGYGGPLVNDPELVEEAMALIFDAMRSMRIISLFSRMHPLFVNDLSADDSKGTRVGDIVVIDVEKHADFADNPEATYRKTHRYDINKARRKGVKVSMNTEGRGLDKFVEVYRQSMEEIGVDDYYLFDKSYFQRLKKANDFQILLIFAELDGVCISAGMNLITGGIMQSYLGGTLEEYRKLSPSKLTTAAEHQFAIRNGIGKFILGGGVRGRVDALFDFKKGFSEFTLPFYIYRKILNLDAYNEVCLQRGVSAADNSYFPAYRIEER